MAQARWLVSLVGPQCARRTTFLLHHPPSLASAGCVPTRFQLAMDSTPAVEAARRRRLGLSFLCSGKAARRFATLVLRGHCVRRTTFLLHYPPSLASAGCVPTRFQSAMDSTPGVADTRLHISGSAFSICWEVPVGSGIWLFHGRPGLAWHSVASVCPPNDVFASPSSFSSLGGMRSDEISTCNGLDPGGGGSSPSPPGSLFSLLGEGRATVRDPGSQGSLRPPNDVFASLSSFSSLGGMRSDEISICNGLDPGGGGHAPPHLGVGTFLCGNEQLGDPRFHHRDARPPELGHPKVRRLRTRSRAGFPGSSPPTPLGAGDVGWPCLGASRTRRATSTQGAFIT